MIIGIDIGTQGALALLTPEGELAEIADMPVLRDGPKNKTGCEPGDARRSDLSLARSPRLR
jgi:hypothetical protein